MGHINEFFNRLLLDLVKRRGLVLAAEHASYLGIIRWHEVPFVDEAEYRRWWLPETVIERGVLRVIREPRMSAREKERYAVAEDKNILTTAGRTQILTFMSSQVSGTAPLAQYFAIGTFPINGVDPGDASVQGEIFRAAPSTTTITGTQVDVATFIGQTQAEATYTNVGLFGINAVGTVGGAGTLMTHALSNYTKGNVPVTADYLLNLQ